MDDALLPLLENSTCAGCDWREDPALVHAALAAHVALGQAAPGAAPVAYTTDSGTVVSSSAAAAPAPGGAPADPLVSGTVLETEGGLLVQPSAARQPDGGVAWTVTVLNAGGAAGPGTAIEVLDQRMACNVAVVTLAAPLL